MHDFQIYSFYYLHNEFFVELISLVSFLEVKGSILRVKCEYFNEDNITRANEIHEIICVIGKRIIKKIKKKIIIILIEDN